MDLKQFAAIRPSLFHITATSNVSMIRQSEQILPAKELLDAAGRSELVRQKRSTMVNVEVDGEQISIRDQAPLYRGNVTFRDGWAFEDLIEHLNAHVFFWPGNRSGPIAFGRRHFGRYAPKRDTTVLELETESVLGVNGQLAPRFSRYNSGSPRCTGGSGSPRGKDTFQLVEDFDGTPSKVVEVVFPGSVSLHGCKIREHDPACF